jgi:hypothetical protein
MAEPKAKDNNLLDKLKNAIKSRGFLGKTRDAADWLIDKAKEAVFGPTQQKRILRDTDRQRDKIFIGNMYFYVYDAKWKDKLPYFDRFPLVIPIERYNNGFLGLNLHYLIPPQRAVLLNRMSSTLTNKRFDESTKFRMNYQTLKGVSKFDMAKPAIKRYLFSHVRSKFIYVPPEEWDIAIYLPAENWSNQKGPAAPIKKKR